MQLKSASHHEISLIANNSLTEKRAKAFLVRDYQEGSLWSVARHFETNNLLFWMRLHFLDRLWDETTAVPVSSIAANREFPTFLKRPHFSQADHTHKEQNSVWYQQAWFGSQGFGCNVSVEMATSCFGSFVTVIKAKWNLPNNQTNLCKETLRNIISD